MSISFKKYPFGHQNFEKNILDNFFLYFSPRILNFVFKKNSAL